MDFQIQSSNFNKEKLNILMDKIASSLSEEDLVSTVRSPEGSENLNPPEVMLIATEANSSFVVNGILLSEGLNDYLNLKIYEAKRGSLIISKKLSLKDNNDFTEVGKFLNLFKEDIIK